MTALPTGDTLYGVARPNWVSNTGIESITSNMEFITISTNVNICTFTQNLTVAGVTSATATSNQLAAAYQSQANLNKLLEIVALRGQPVIMGPVTLADSNSYFTIYLATEHAGGWLNAATAAEISTNSWPAVTLPDVRSGEDLLSRIVADGINFGFGANTSSDTPTGVNDTPSTGTNGGLTVTFSSVL